MFYEKKVDMRSKQAMIEFLRGHPRYFTMSSWNRETSYANLVKIQHVGLAREQANKAYEILDTDYWDEIRWPIDVFTRETGGRYTILTNGRSGGYLVLYQVEYYDPVSRVSGSGIDQDEDFSDWSIGDLRDRVELVCQFDRTCDEIRDAFINILDDCKVVEETVMVPQTVRRLVKA